ncbi:MAG: YciI-like protein [Terriglobales bacterium]
MHYLLFYEVADDYLKRRAEFRDAHLEKACKASDRGELVLGGALQDPVDGAVLLFTGDSPEVAEKFARTDPYVTGGLVKRWHVREWKTVAGEDSAEPIRPNAVAGKITPSIPSSDSGANNGTIIRMWRGRATAAKSRAYIEHVTMKVFPALAAIDGHRGAYLLRRAVDGETQDGAIDFVVLTLWESMVAVRRFAGANPDKAVVEPEARAVLSSFDESVTHFEVVHGTNDVGR